MVIDMKKHKRPFRMHLTSIMNYADKLSRGKKPIPVHEVNEVVGALAEWESINAAKVAAIRVTLSKVRVV